MFIQNKLQGKGVLKEYLFKMCFMCILRLVYGKWFIGLQADAKYSEIIYFRWTFNFVGMVINGFKFPTK